MTDQLEERLRSSLHSAMLPAAPIRLREYLDGLPALDKRTMAPAGYGQMLRIAAVLAIVIVGAGLTFVLLPPDLRPGLPSGPSPTPTLSPAPTASPAPTDSPPPTAKPVASPLPEPAALLNDQPTATIRLERSVGPADRPVSTDASVERIDLADLQLSDHIVLAGACLGTGELSLDIRFPALGPENATPFAGLFVPCDGFPRKIEYGGGAGAAASDIQLVAVSVPRGASWRLVAADLPAASDEPPSWTPIELSGGWWPLWDIQPSEQARPDQGSGVEFEVAGEVTRVAAWVQCEGDAVFTLTLDRTDSDYEGISIEFKCPIPVGTRRFEFPVSPGEHMALRGTSDSPAWLRLFLEADNEPVTVYPAAPPLPRAVADTPYAVANVDYVALGTIGGNRQKLLRAPGTYPRPIAGGDFVAVNGNGLEGSALYLASISEGTIVRKLAEVGADRFIGANWIDPVHEQVFYIVGQRSQFAIEVHRVALDGSAAQLVATAGPGDRVMAELALDYSDFVLDACGEAGCTRQLIDAATLSTVTLDLELGAEYCELVGVSHGLAIIAAADSCADPGSYRTIAMPVDATTGQVLEGVTGATLVATSDGAQVVFKPTEGASDWGVMNVATGDVRSLQVGADETFAPYQFLRLPPDWVLFSSFTGLDDFPGVQLGKNGKAPILVNVLTAETIEVVNLPH